MRIKDYLFLGWDQLRRRKVVTLLCVMGIAIGSASIIVALAFGESIAHYSEKQMSYYLKTDEITIIDHSGGRSEAGSGGAGRNDYSITDQKLDLIRSLPHVKTVAKYDQLGHFEFTVDDGKKSYFNITATQLETLPDFGIEFGQGAPSDQDNVIILSYNSLFGIRDPQTARREAMRSAQMSPVDLREQPLVAYPLYRKQMTITKTIHLGDGTVRTIDFPVRVIAVERRAEGMSDDMVRFSEKKAYISLGLAEQIKKAVAAVSPQSGGAEFGGGATAKVKIDHVNHVASTEKLIQSLKLNTQTNLRQQERMAQEFVIFRLIFGGAGMFILFVASISIIVAMTMSTHQRRRQIGIMKVLGANLKQIRNMFVVESALLGLFGGLAGILFSYWVIWGINILLIQFSGVRPGQDPEILFISLWILPLGLFFALLTGILSGIFPAVKASRTDALTAIKRD